MTINSGSLPFSGNASVGQPNLYCAANVHLFLAANNVTALGADNCVATFQCVERANQV